MQSKELAGFLNYLRQAEEQARIAQTIEQEAEAATQDILHKLELEDVPYHTGAKLARMLESIRKERRTAKDCMLVLKPLIDWMHENKAVVKGMERVLGDMRREEKFQQNRSYVQKTKVLQKI